MKYRFWGMFIVCLLPITANAIEFHVDQSMENMVKFVSRTTFEDFEVKTGKMDGYAYWDGETFPPEETQLKTSELYMEVQLNSLDAGNSMYNRHMKGEYLETKKYPYASYKAQITKVDRISDSTYDVHARGVFSIHGVGKTVDIVARATSSGGGWNVICDFAVKMSDYEIELPKMMFLKADEIIDINLDFYIKLEH